MVFQFADLHMRMSSPLFGPQIYIFCLKLPTSCLRTAKALARLRLCAGSPEPLLVAYVINTLFPCADSNVDIFFLFLQASTLLILIYAHYSELQGSSVFLCRLWQLCRCVLPLFLIPCSSGASGRLCFGVVTFGVVTSPM